MNIELQELKKNVLSVLAYLHKAKALADELSVACRTLTTTEFNAIIYRNIGSDHHGVITALNLHPEPISFHELYENLVAHEVLVKYSHLLPIANSSVKQAAPSSATSTPPTNSSSRPPFN